MLLVTALPVEAGVLLESGHTPTLVLKSTWVPSEEGTRFAPVQLPLNRSIAHLDGIHLYYPSDFVPAKPRLDLVVCGMRSDGRGTPFSVSVDDWYRRFRSFQPEGAEVAEAAMHTPEGELFARLSPVDAPMASYRARRWQFADAALSLPLRGMPRSVRVDDGRAPVTWAWSEMLHLFAQMPDGNVREIRLACDTIFADVSTRTLVLLHRAELSVRLPTEVFVAMRPTNAPAAGPPPRDRAGVLVAEYEVSHVDAAPYRPQNGWTRAATLRETAKLDSQRSFDDDLPFGRERASSPSIASQRASSPSIAAQRASSPAFDPSATIPATMSPLAGMGMTATPFQPRAPFPSSPTGTAYPPPPVEVVVQARLPGSYPPPPAAARRESIPEITPAPAAAAPPAAIEPPAQAAPATMTLDDYARVRARLSAGDTLENALAGLGFEPAAYGQLDRSVAQQLAREARAGQNDLATRLKQLVRKASAERG